MNKDTIYIDIEDDITAIIGKVKAAKSKVVALVPPKRTGVLQSAVNLRLLARAAKQSNKRLVLVSGNSALTALAASAGIPSARTLQSKPELVPPQAISSDAEEDIIDGAELPIGDLARTDESGNALEPAAAPAIDEAIRATDAEEPSPARSYARPHTAKRSGIKVPNFNTFRRKLVLGIVGAVLLGGFLVWAIMFAPRATIAITARTIESSANPKVTISTASTTDASAATLKAVQQEIKREASLTFDATGTKEVGERAEGEVIFRNCRSTRSITIAAGTGISAKGMTYITQEAVSVPGMAVDGGCEPGVSRAVTVVAQDIGSDYNTDKDTRFSVSGQPSVGQFTFMAVATTAIDGGSRREVKVVTEGDVEKATERMKSENSQGMRQQLEERFGEDMVALEATFAVDHEGVVANPAVDAEVKDAEASLTGTLVFTMLGVSSAEIDRFLDAYFESELEESEQQRVYDNGADRASFITIEPGEDEVYTATMTATATFGPKIDDANVKAQARGKRYGDVQSAIERISGIESVDVRFSPFWVRTVPQDENRIMIEFNLDESESA